MACDREILLRISSYVDGEATPIEAQSAEEHLAHCSDCRKLVEQWLGHQQLFAWAYTRELPDTLDTDALIGMTRKEHPQNKEQASTTTVTGKPRRTAINYWRWGRIGAVAASLFLAVFFIRLFVLQSFLLVGHQFVTYANAKSTRIGMHVTLEVGPHSIIRRIGEHSLRLEQGWVAASVRHGAGMTIETSRMKVTDRGTRFHVGIGTKSDYVTVEEGTVEVAARNAQRTISAGQVLLTSAAGEITVMSIPPLPPGETDTTQPLRTYNPEFTPNTMLGIEQTEGIRRLATRFPDVRIKGDSWVGGCSVGMGQDSALFTVKVGGMREAMRAHIVQIAQLASGAKLADGKWGIPVEFMQVIGYQKQTGLVNDVYFVQLVPKEGVLTWRFVGSKGQQVDLPVTFEASRSEGGTLDMEGSLRDVRCDIITHPHNNRQMRRTMQLIVWPGTMKPTLELRIDWPQHLTVWDEELALMSKIERQFQHMPEIVFNPLDCLNVYYLDSQRKHRMILVGNENCGQQICRAYELSKQGNSASAVLGVLVSDMPLISPLTEKGVYMVRFVFPGATQASHLELTTIDKRYIATWGGSSCILPSSGLPEKDLRHGICYNTNTPPAYGNIGFVCQTTAAHNQAFSFRIRISGGPNDANSRDNGIPPKEWVTGWLSIQQP